MPRLRRCIYHITHVDNLGPILSQKELISDRRILEQGGPAVVIGMSTIKERRLKEIGVPCHPGTHVGDFVPFYFCPRSVMLYLLHCGNSPELTYRGGQGPIVHLEARVDEAIDWAETNARRWAFSLSNAGAFAVQFRNRRDELDEIDWGAVAATNWSHPDVKHRKQAEFLTHRSFPVELVRRIGVRSPEIAAKVRAALAPTDFEPVVDVLPSWYY